MLLASVDPALLLLGVFAIPTVLTSSWRPAVERAAEEAGRRDKRLATHLFTTATTAPPGKEVRVTGIGPRLIAQRRRGVGALVRAGGRGPLALGALAQPGLGDLRRRLRGRAWCTSPTASTRSAGDVLLVLAAGSRLSAYIGATVGEIGFLRGIWMDGSQRLAWLEDYAAGPRRRTPTCPCPTASTQGITFDDVSFAYPGTDRLVLQDVSLTLPAGAVVAVVGENGAGKSTLVKLLAKLYEPTSGRILVDDVDLARVPAEGWRDRLAGRLPGLLPLRAARPAERRPRRRGPSSTTSPRSWRPSTGPGRTTSWRGWRPGSTPSSDRRGPRASR